MVGDIVASRQAPRPEELRRRVTEALAETNARVDALQPLQPTIGDEFQGVYGRVGQALNAALLIRLLLADLTDVRFGVGWGAFTWRNPDRLPYEQDGPAWWRAREALEAVRGRERRVGTPSGWTTGIQLSAAAGRQTEDPPIAEPLFRTDQYLIDSVPLDLDGELLIEGLVMFRDHVVGMLDDRDVALVLALLKGQTVTQAAEQQGVSQQAASRRLRANGGYSLLRGWDLLERAC